MPNLWKEIWLLRVYNRVRHWCAKHIVTWERTITSRPQEGCKVLWQAFLSVCLSARSRISDTTRGRTWCTMLTVAAARSSYMSSTSGLWMTSFSHTEQYGACVFTSGERIDSVIAETTAVSVELQFQGKNLLNDKDQQGLIVSCTPERSLLSTIAVCWIYESLRSGFLMLGSHNRRLITSKTHKWKIKLEIARPAQQCHLRRSE